MLIINHVTVFRGYISAAGVGSWQLKFRFRMSERESSGFLLVWPHLGPLGFRSSDLVDRADRTTSGYPAAMGEWRSGALDGTLCAEMVVAYARFHLIFFDFV